MGGAGAGYEESRIFFLHCGAQVLAFFKKWATVLVLGKGKALDASYSCKGSGESECRSHLSCPLIAI
jgi:hypothetical protein